MTQTIEREVANDEPRPRWYHQVTNGIAIAVGIFSALTVAFGWWVIIDSFDNLEITPADMGMLSAFALLATVGLILYIVAYRRRALGLAGLGLLCVAVAPTGFAYIGNAVALVAALGLWVVVIHRRLNRRTRRPTSD